MLYRDQLACELATGARANREVPQEYQLAIRVRMCAGLSGLVVVVTAGWSAAPPRSSDPPPSRLNLFSHQAWCGRAAAAVAVVLRCRPPTVLPVDRCPSCQPDSSIRHVIKKTPALPAFLSLLLLLLLSSLLPSSHKHLDPHPEQNRLLSPRPDYQHHKPSEYPVHSSLELVELPEPQS